MKLVGSDTLSSTLDLSGIGVESSEKDKKQTISFSSSLSDSASACGYG
jgi:hypothetical protein